MKFDGEDSFEDILPKVLYGRVGDVAVPPLVQQSAAPPVVALLCAQGWVSPLLRWLLVVLVCDFVFFLAPRGFWLVWVDERDFDVSLKGLFGAPDLGFLDQEGFGCCDAGRTAGCDEEEHARLFEDLPAMLSVYCDAAIARRLLCCVSLATSSHKLGGSRTLGGRNLE